MGSAPLEVVNRRESPQQKTWIWVLLFLFTLSLVIGVIAFWRFTISDRYLMHSFDQLHLTSKERSVEQCIDALLRWSEQCQGMKTLCEASLPRAMEACLSSRDRNAYCARVNKEMMSTRFGFPECKARGLDRARKKVCAIGYRAVAAHCERLPKEKMR